MFPSDIAYSRLIPAETYAKLKEDLAAEFPEDILQYCNGNENTNCLFRQYSPKKTDFSKVTIEEIKFAQHQLNNKPRKVLD